MCNPRFEMWNERLVWLFWRMSQEQRLYLSVRYEFFKRNLNTFYVYINTSGSRYGTHWDQDNSSVHKWKSFINTSYSLFAFHTNKRQYFDTLHIQKKKEMHRWMHNNDFDILLRSVHLSPKLQIPKTHKNIQKIKCYPCNTSRVFEFSYKLYLTQN